MSPDTHRAIAAAQSPELALGDENPASSSAAVGDENPASSSAAVGGEATFPAAVLPGTGPGGSLEAVLAQRLGHIQRGLTPQSDAQGPDCFLENELERWIHRARLTRSKTGDDPAAALLRARRSYVHAAAVALAIIDRIDFIASTNASSSAAVGGESPASSSAAVGETSKDNP